MIACPVPFDTLRRFPRLTHKATRCRTPRLSGQVVGGAPQTQLLARRGARCRKRRPRKVRVSGRLSVRGGPGFAAVCRAFPLRCPAWGLRSALSGAHGRLSGRLLSVRSSATLGGRRARHYRIHPPVGASGRPHHRCSVAPMASRSGSRCAARAVCSSCGQVCRQVHDGALRRWRHLDLGDSPCHIAYELRRVRCPDCGVRVEAVPWARTGARHTRDLRGSRRALRPADCQDADLCAAADRPGHRRRESSSAVAELEAGAGSCSRRFATCRPEEAASYHPRHPTSTPASGTA